VAVRSSDELLLSLTLATSFWQVAPFSWDKDLANTMAYDSALFINSKAAISMRQTLKELCHLPFATADVDSNGQFHHPRPNQQQNPPKGPKSHGHEIPLSKMLRSTRTI
jgi:hypothetical protein